MEHDPAHDPRFAGDAASLTRRRATGALAVGTSAIAWWPAFTVGAWGSSSLEQLMLLWGVSIPEMAVLLLRVASPEALDVRDRRDRLAAGLVVLVVVVMSYGAGVLNANFLTCGDFTVSGNSAPPGCNPGDPTLGSSHQP